MMVSFDTNIFVYATVSAPFAHRARDLVRGMRTNISCRRPACRRSAVVVLCPSRVGFAPITDRPAASRLGAQIDCTIALSGRRSDVGVREIVAFEQQRFTCELGERRGKAIAEIQLGRMAAAFAEIAIGLPCNSSLGFGYGLNDDLRLFDQVVEPPAGDGVTARVYDDRGFHEISG